MSHHYETKPRQIAGHLWRLAVIDSLAVPGSRTVRAEFCHLGDWMPGTTCAGGSDDSLGVYGLPSAVANAFKRELPDIDRIVGRPEERTDMLGGIVQWEMDEYHKTAAENQRRRLQRAAELEREREALRAKDLAANGDLFPSF